MITDFEKYGENYLKYIGMILEINEMYRKYMFVINSIKRKYIHEIFTDLSNVIIVDTEKTSQIFSDAIKKNIDVLTDGFCNYFKLDIVKDEYFVEAMSVYPYEIFKSDNEYEKAYSNINMLKLKISEIDNNIDFDVIPFKNDYIISSFMYICSYYSKSHKFLDIPKNNYKKYLENSIIYEKLCKYIIDNLTEEELEKYKIHFE